MEVIKGFIGAIEAVRLLWRCFAAGAAVTEKCYEIGSSRKEFTFYLKRFT